MTCPPITTLARWREDLASTLELMPLPLRAELVKQAVLDAGGTWVPVPQGSNWGPHFAELSLGGICASGASMDECIAHWIKLVHRSSHEEAAA